MSKDALAIAQDFSIQPHELDEIAALITENVGEGGITVNDLDRIKVPAGGGLFWEVPSAEGEPEAVKELHCIVIGKRTVRAYWESEPDAGSAGTPPDCSSADGLTGQARTEAGPGGICATCRLNQFSTAKAGGGRGKACKERNLLMALLPDSKLPVVVSVPPGSLGEVRKAFLRLSGKSLRYMQVVFKLVLEAAKNADGIKYAKVVPKMVRRLTDEEMTTIANYAAAVMPAFNKITIDEASHDDFVEE